MYAVVKTGGKQYRVAPGEVFVVERLQAEAGDQIKLDQVLMVGEDGKSPQIGVPVLGNTTVTCEVLDQNRADKIIVFKKKRRTGYKRTRGHRQLQTVLRVLDINGMGAVEPVAQARIQARIAAQAKAAPAETSTDEAGDEKPTRARAKSKAPAKKAAATKRAPAKKAPARKAPAKKAPAKKKK